MAIEAYSKRTALTANTAAVVAEAPADLPLYVDIALVNRGTASVRLRLFLDTENTPAGADYLEYDTLLHPGYPIVWRAIPLPPGLKVYARVDGADCNAVAGGEAGIPQITSELPE